MLNAADYGVPQNRQRLFLIGSHDGTQLELPKATHWGEHERRLPPENVAKLAPHVTAGEALRGLETKPEEGESVNGKWGHLLPEIPPGRNYLHYTEELGHPEPLFRWRSRYWTFLLKLDPNRPSPTLQGQPGPYVGPFHWENRRLRVPELKRLHGFPDDYVLEGTRRDAVLQVGNAVPPLLGEVVARAVSDQVDAARPTHLGGRPRGRTTPQPTPGPIVVPKPAPPGTGSGTLSCVPDDLDLAAWLREQCAGYAFDVGRHLQPARGRALAAHGDRRGRPRGAARRPRAPAAAAEGARGAGQRAGGEGRRLPARPGRRRSRGRVAARDRALLPGPRDAPVRRSAAGYWAVDIKVARRPR